MKGYKVYYSKWDENVFLTMLYTFHEASLLVKVLKDSGVNAYIEELL